MCIIYILCNYNTTWPNAKKQIGVGKYGICFTIWYGDEPLARWSRLLSTSWVHCRLSMQNFVYIQRFSSSEKNYLYKKLIKIKFSDLLISLYAHVNILELKSIIYF